MHDSFKCEASVSGETILKQRWICTLFFSTFIDSDRLGATSANLTRKKMHHLKQDDEGQFERISLYQRRS